MIAVPKKAAAKTELSSPELERRVAILKRFRELLAEQRNHFRQYLEVLDKQKDVIEHGSPDDLIFHVELEEKIISDIFTMQKVIDPLETMYQANYPAPLGKPNKNKTATAGITANNAAGTNALPGGTEEVPSLRAALEELRHEAVSRSARNRDLLSKRMEELRQEMKTLRANPYAIHRSAFSQESAALVDIKG